MKKPLKSVISAGLAEGLHLDQVSYGNAGKKFAAYRILRAEPVIIRLAIMLPRRHVFPEVPAGIAIFRAAAFTATQAYPLKTPHILVVVRVIPGIFHVLLYIW